MSRIAIIGNGGGGKSTLAVRLGLALGLPVHHIDKLQFQPGWKRTPPDELRRAHDEILSLDRWIIDGWSVWALIEERFAAADTIVVVDLPLARHYARALKRQVLYAFRPTPDRPENCLLWSKTWEMMKVLWMVHRRMRPRMLELASGYREGRTVIHIRTVKEWREFERIHCRAA